jgi:hypothetical protein
MKEATKYVVNKVLRPYFTVWFQLKREVHACTCR